MAGGRAESERVPVSVVWGLAPPGTDSGREEEPLLFGRAAPGPGLHLRTMEGAWNRGSPFRLSPWKGRSRFGLSPGSPQQTHLHSGFGQIQAHRQLFPGRETTSTTDGHSGEGLERRGSGGSPRLPLFKTPPLGRRLEGCPPPGRSPSHASRCFFALRSSHPPPSSCLMLPPRTRGSLAPTVQQRRPCYVLPRSPPKPTLESGWGEGGGERNAPTGPTIQGSSLLAGQRAGGRSPPSVAGVRAAPTSEGAAAQGRSIELQREPFIAVISATIKANRSPLGCWETAHNLFTSTLPRVPGGIGSPFARKKSASQGARPGGGGTAATRLCPPLPGCRRKAPARLAWPQSSRWPSPSSQTPAGTWPAAAGRGGGGGGSAGRPAALAVQGC